MGRQADRQKSGQSKDNLGRVTGIGRGEESERQQRAGRAKDRAKWRAARTSARRRRSTSANAVIDTTDQEIQSRGRPQGRAPHSEGRGEVGRGLGRTSRCGKKRGVTGGGDPEPAMRGGGLRPPFPSYECPQRPRRWLLRSARPRSSAPGSPAIRVRDRGQSRASRRASRP